MKLSFEKARKVPPIVTESGMTLNALPPWNFPTVTTCVEKLSILGRLRRLKVLLETAFCGIQ